MKFRKDFFRYCSVHKHGHMKMVHKHGHMKAENTKNGSVDSFVRQNRQQMRVCVTVNWKPFLLEIKDFGNYF